MLPSRGWLRRRIEGVITSKARQGHVVDRLGEELSALPDSYDALMEFAGRLVDLPMREDWPYHEPNDLAGIWAECDPDRPGGAMCEVDLDDAARRVEAAFLGSVCGCMLGKPVEFDPTMAQLREALEATGEWPLDDYVSEKTLDALSQRHKSWATTVRESLHFVAPDDDINYTIVGMMMLEQRGLDFTAEDIRDTWMTHLPFNACWGPERMMLIRTGITHLNDESDPRTWADFLNPSDEMCGALIRADAYGYACPGRPALAAELAWQDASFSHRRTGIYATMFTAAAIAAAQVVDSWDDIFATALQFVPARSRFHEIAADSLRQVRDASDWLDGYERIHGKYGQYTHCKVYQEIGTVMNTLRFAASVGDGICKQVSQGNDTDSFGATAGSILGAFFGPGHLDDRWLAPFNDRIEVGLGWFYEHSLSALAERMARLPALIAEQLQA